MLRGFDDERRLTEVQQPLTSPPPLKEVAQPFRHRQHPLPHWQARKHMIDQMRRRLDHAPCVTGRAHAAALAGVGDEKFVLAGVTPGTDKAVGEDAALEIATEAALDIRWRRLASGPAGQFQPGGEVRLDGAIPQRLLGTAALINRLYVSLLWRSY
jgi:hypothetical protein